MPDVQPPFEVPPTSGPLTTPEVSAGPAPEVPRMIARDDWMRAIERVLRGEGFALTFQPIIDLKHGAVVAYEALSRFAPADGIGMLAPPEWFEAARRLGVAAELEARVVAAALDARDRLPPNTFLTLNLSPWVVDTEPVRRVLESPRGLHRVVVEVTENAVVEDYPALAETFAALRRRGAYIAVDDAGAGYASLAHVLRLRPDFVKLDQSLTTALDQDEAKLALVEMFGQFAGRVDAWLIAEGVETLGELTALGRLDVPLAQGYYLGRPEAHWSVLAPEVRQLLLRAASAAEVRHTVEPFVEPWPYVEQGREEEGAALIREALEPGSQQLAVVPVLDEYRRPIGIYPVADAGPPRIIARVKRHAPVTEAARSAMTRPYLRRFDPVACIEEDGTYVGVVRVERLIEALTSAVEAPHRPLRGRQAA
jgi:EAL domain-containing protein (putative c-di-GMP-specific phosphodiesterase class I)